MNMTLFVNIYKINVIRQGEDEAAGYLRCLRAVTRVPSLTSIPVPAGTTEERV